MNTPARLQLSYSQLARPPSTLALTFSSRARLPVAAPAQGLAARAGSGLVARAGLVLTSVSALPLAPVSSPVAPHGLRHARQPHERSPRAEALAHQIRR